MAGDVCRSAGYSQLFSERDENLKQMTCSVVAKWWIWPSQLSGLSVPQADKWAGLLSPFSWLMWHLLHQMHMSRTLWWGDLAAVRGCFNRGRSSPGRRESAIHCILLSTSFLCQHQPSCPQLEASLQPSLQECCLTGVNHMYFQSIDPGSCGKQVSVLLAFLCKMT